MRILLALIFLASPALADCGFDPGRADVPERMSRDAARAIACLEDRLDTLTDENTALQARIEELEVIVASIPSTYAALDGRGNDTSPPFASASFDLQARPRGRAFDVALDHVVILDLCADPEGCLLSLASTSETAGAAPDLGRIGPCAFSYEAETGAWSLQPACGGRTGIDGDGRLPGAEMPSGQVLLAIGNDCALTEAGLGVRADEAGQATLGRDRDQGLNLVSGLVVGEGEVPGEYLCRLTVRD